MGGLSSIAYDPHTRLYYAISDDRGDFNAPRYYTLGIDVSDGSLDPGDINLCASTPL